MISLHHTFKLGAKIKPCVPEDVGGTQPTYGNN